MKSKIIVFLMILISVFYVLPCSANLSEDVNKKLDPFASQSGIKNENNADITVSQYIGKIVTAVLSFVGVIFFVLVLWGGFLWMTAHGKSDQVDQATTIIIQATVGIAVIMCAYVITLLVVQAVGKASGVKTGMEADTSATPTP